MKTKRIKISGEVPVGENITLKTKLKRNVKGTPFIMVIYKGRATSAFFSHAIQELFTEAGLKEGDSLKNLLKVITITLYIYENGEVTAQLHP